MNICEIYSKFVFMKTRFIWITKILSHRTEYDSDAIFLKTKFKTDREYEYFAYKNKFSNKHCFTEENLLDLRFKNPTAHIIIIDMDNASRRVQLEYADSINRYLSIYKKTKRGV